MCIRSMASLKQTSNVISKCLGNVHTFVVVVLLYHSFMDY